MAQAAPRSAACVVALCGARGAGKDAVAAVLAREAGFVNHKFARPLKDALATLFSLDAAHVDGPLKDVVHERWGVTPRALMQWFGTEVMQHGLRAVVPSVGRGFWAERLRASLRSALERDPAARIVVSDMRFEHELEALRAEFGDRLVAVRVERASSSSAPSRAPSTAPASPDDRHESETSPAKLRVDLVISNDASLARLELVARGLLRFGELYESAAPARGGVARLIGLRDGQVTYERVRAGQRPGDVRVCSARRWIERYRPVVLPAAASSASAASRQRHSP